jgi:hypothetical protein
MENMNNQYQALKSIENQDSYRRHGHDVEDLSDVVVQIFRLGRILPDPLRPLQVHVLDQQRVERVDVPDVKHVYV